MYKMIGLALFTDVGSVWSDPEHFRFKDLRISPGIGLRVNTPIGLARLDLGFNAKKKRGEPGTMIYFSMGQAF